jgi:hypothetical protein
LIKLISLQIVEMKINKTVCDSSITILASHVYYTSIIRGQDLLLYWLVKFCIPVLFMVKIYCSTGLSSFVYQYYLWSRFISIQYLWSSIYATWLICNTFAFFFLHNTFVATIPLFLAILPIHNTLYRSTLLTSEYAFNMVDHQILNEKSRLNTFTA